MKFLIGGEQWCDLGSLLESRLLLNANSGAGKSWLLRRILEQTFGHVQHIIIDPEGEFASLREKYDYVLAAKQGGDVVADPRLAKMLAHRLLDLNVSAIIDIYELKAQDRKLFVRLFCEALVDAPKKLWHPVIVVIDEAHVFAPQKGEAESMAAVIDLATRGRKRGFCSILATQRLSKLHKDAAAEMNNKLMGRAAQDIDMKRAAEELGFTGREEQHELRNLEPGEFFCFGPAISRTVQKVMVGSVETSHPKAGSRIAVEAPPPTAAVKALLPKLGDLPAEAEQERKTLEDTKRELSQARRDLTLAKKEQRPPDESVIERRVAVAVGAKERELAGEQRVAAQRVTSLERVIKDTSGQLAGLAEKMAKAVNGAAPQGVALYDVSKVAPIPPPPRQERPEPRPAPEPPPQAEMHGSLEGLKSGAIRILGELASRHPLTLSKAQVGTLTGFTPSGGTFGTYVSELKRRGLIEISGKEVSVTDLGLDAAGEVPAAPTTHEEAMAIWRRNLKAGCYRMLEIIVSYGSPGIERDELAEVSGFTASGGTFGTYLGILRRNELISVQGSTVAAQEILFPGATS